MDEIGELMGQLEALRASFEAQRDRHAVIARNIAATKGELDKLHEDVHRLRTELAGIRKTLDQLEARQRTAHCASRPDGKRGQTVFEGERT